jgi:hypothetical protein
MHTRSWTVWRGSVASGTNWVLLNFQLAPAPNPILRAAVVEVVLRMAVRWGIEKQIAWCALLEARSSGMTE